MDIHQSHFALFGLAEAFAIDLAALDAAYRFVQAEVHPDRFASAGASERRVALQWATKANEAYQTLKDPLSRARYLCESHGVDLGIESNTHMPAEFLMAQMTWREALEDAEKNQDGHALEVLDRELSDAYRRGLDEVAVLIDDDHDYHGAADAIRRLMFLAKTLSDVSAAQDALAA
jgi:molecular chaperone HscB